MVNSKIGRLAWSPLAPFGVRIEFDLRETLTEEEQQSLRTLLWEYEVLVFPGQSLTHPRQIEILRNFGPVEDSFEGAHYVSTDKDKGVLGTQELTFHSDASFLPKLRQALSLHATDLVDGTSSTKFVSGTRAAARLPEALRRRIEGLTGVHALEVPPYSDRSSTEAFPFWVPRHSHPLLLPHPVTGKPILFVTQMHTARVDGLPVAESRALIEDLLAQVMAPDNTLEHTWYLGDLVIWDNVATQHARGKLTGVGSRTLQKVQTAAASFKEQWPYYESPELQKALMGMSTNYERPSGR